MNLKLRAACEGLVGLTMMPFAAGGKVRKVVVLVHSGFRRAKEWGANKGYDEKPLTQ